MKTTGIGRLGRAAVCAGAAVVAGSAIAQSASPTSPASPTAQGSDAARRTDVASGTRRVVDPRWATLNNLMRTLTIQFEDNRLEDVMKFIKDATGADLEVFWADDSVSIGLDKDRPITLKAERITGLAILEKVLEKAMDASLGPAGGATWQMTDSGTMQVGPKERLNKFRRLEIYDINDLLFEITDRTDAPTFDLNQAFQSGQGGGGGQSPFQQQQQQNPLNPQRKQEKSEEIRELITSLIETEQWVDNGGDGASISFWKNAFMINAPDYIHRQIDGYPYWPSTQTVVGSNNGRRWVTLNGTHQASEIVNVRQIEAQGAVPGSGR